ncbi:MAG: hypothetical protein A3G52_00225 [Candidatus Taylorbacteria bacterium RIFCSPLOWO2_12_FULL_43_20]|uniref:Uncharacterized protein n=1 Tax=Candidatus Taylorbacteria bacterium RIFCSPLOWO2_12_FULL_43_20 TaxID=1802332 RepID=A0A1G2P1G8_9BACT|nr:MAG: hypothetical protein A2825_01620 [Candidatus Taylorbacteria bacterium RIFCSPHIGHO2_01_FULL_43_120]OHA23108.1 MAG: hypothetical protein A3B98_03585 [Candidatus Taylorbacteria bacterium RIFCSPHIGHO2_02_FULL_43_55]OHA28911.1 MAG: hypothetical protein A3E92_04545 [Candidatus Taylorbacteria bacterium RIFCSPHIGHO2_12_FULL_42_34]OHA30895.1 MAG: hypothetical protein A3B09_04495 [Candidatus Taylorbacteria bacterium RIFCSPLOWO2_01_FULL_43_83]OHA39311.1 MAG: hypothetical protein A3H58_03965 [Candi
MDWSIFLAFLTAAIAFAVYIVIKKPYATSKLKSVNVAQGVSIAKNTGKIVAKLPRIIFLALVGIFILTILGAFTIATTRWLFGKPFGHSEVYRTGPLENTWWAMWKSPPGVVSVPSEMVFPNVTVTKYDSRNLVFQIPSVNDDGTQIIGMYTGLSEKQDGQYVGMWAAVTNFTASSGPISRWHLSGSAETGFAGQIENPVETNYYWAAFTLVPKFKINK